jgi:hypothetical protein
VSWRAAPSRLLDAARRNASRMAGANGVKKKAAPSQPLRHAAVYRAWGRQAVPARGLLQVCSRRHGALHLAWWRQTLPRAGLLQGSCYKRHAALQGAWRRQTVPGGGCAAYRLTLATASFSFFVGGRHLRCERCGVIGTSVRRHQPVLIVIVLRRLRPSSVFRTTYRDERRCHATRAIATTGVNLLHVRRPPAAVLRQPVAMKMCLALK